MSNPNFEVVFNVDPVRPIGTIEGFTRKGDADTLIPPGRMKDVLDDTVGITIGESEYRITKNGGVVATSVMESIGKLSSQGVPFQIGEGVFIGRGVQFDVGGAMPSEKQSGYSIADGSAIGHRFQTGKFVAMDEVGISSNKLPVSTPKEAEALIEASFDHPGGRLSIKPDFELGKAAVLWSVNALTSIAGGVSIGDEAQVFAASIGRCTQIASQTIVSPSRGLIGPYRLLEPNRESPREH